MFRMGKHEKSGWQKIRDSWVWCYLLMAVLFTMPVWMPVLGLV